jgi:hypothetical protein
MLPTIRPNIKSAFDLTARPGFHFAGHAERPPVTAAVAAVLVVKRG